MSVSDLAMQAGGKANSERLPFYSARIRSAIAPGAGRFMQTAERAIAFCSASAACADCAASGAAAPRGRCVEGL